jgi:TolB-like protein
MHVGLLLLLSLGAQLAPAVPGSCRVAVMDLEGQGLPADQAHLAKVLTEALAASVADASKCEVITRQDIASMIELESERASCGGDVSDSCLSEIGNALGVERMVAGSVARVGTSTTVTARLLNMKAGKVEMRAEETTSDDALLRASAQNVGKRLFGVAVVVAPVAPVVPVNDGPSLPLLLGGGVVGVAGLSATAVGGVMALGADAILGSKTSDGLAKKDARDSANLAIIVGGAGLGVVVVGGVVAGLAFVLE